MGNYDGRLSRGSAGLDSSSNPLEAPTAIGPLEKMRLHCEAIGDRSIEQRRSHRAVRFADACLGSYSVDVLPSTTRKTSPR